MGKIIGTMLFVLFMGGTMIAPAFHRLHCCCHDDGDHATHKHTTHDAGHCPICQLAIMPVIAAPLHVTLIAESVVSDNVDELVSVVPSAYWRDTTQARAPPVA